MFKEIMSYINVVMKRINKNIILSLKNKDKNINFELNNDLYNHFKTLNPMQQEIIKQTMQLKYLELNFDN
jgi:predicted choloylglycine hydrolase